MKNKWIIFGMLLAIGMIFLGPQNAKADTWAVASINLIGQATTNTHVKITVEGTDIINQWFQLKAAKSKEMLAIALTAASLGRTIQVQIDTDGITINTIRMLN